MAEDPEGARRVSETAGDVAGGLVVDEEGAKSFVLTLHGELRGQEELLIRLRRYLIYSTGLHTTIVLQNHTIVKMFGRAGGNMEWNASRMAFGAYNQVPQRYTRLRKLTG